MAEGLRIRPRTGYPFPDTAMVVVRDHGRPFTPPASGQRLEDVQPLCSVCGIQHFEKAYHIQLRDGTAIVSQGVWEGLQALRSHTGDLDNPFELVNPVPDPPGILIFPGQERAPQLVEKFVMPLRVSAN